MRSCIDDTDSSHSPIFELLFASVATRTDVDIVPSTLFAIAVYILHLLIRFGVPVFHTQIVCLAFATRAIKDRLIPVHTANGYDAIHNPPDTFSFVPLQYAWSAQSASCHRCNGYSTCTTRANQTLAVPSAALVRPSTEHTHHLRNRQATGSSFETDLRTFDYDIEVVVVLTTYTAFKLIGQPFKRVAHITIASVIKPAESICYHFVIDVHGFNRMDLPPALCVREGSSLLFNTKNGLTHNYLLPKNRIAIGSGVLLAHRQPLRVANGFILEPYPNVSERIAIPNDALLDLTIVHDHSSNPSTRSAPR